MAQNHDYPSVNKLAEPLVRSLKENIDSLRLSVNRLENGTAIVDAGINAQGGLEAGCRIAEICMGGLGNVTLRATTNLIDNRVVLPYRAGGPTRCANFADQRQ